MAINAEGWLIHSPVLFLGQGRSSTFVFERVGFYSYIFFEILFECNLWHNEYKRLFSPDIKIWIPYNYVEV